MNFAGVAPYVIVIVGLFLNLALLQNTAMYNKRIATFKKLLGEDNCEEDRLIAKCRIRIAKQLSSKQWQIMLIIDIVGIIFLVITSSATDGSQEDNSITWQPMVKFLMVALMVLFFFVWQAGKKNQLTMTENLEKDKRPPVLLLRPFVTDGKGLITNGVFGRYFKRIMAYQNMIITSANKIGPVIALGNPNKTPDPLYIGASLGYIDDFKKIIPELIDKASMIIMIPSDTENVLWEFDYIVKGDYLAKTVFQLRYNKVPMDQTESIQRFLEKANQAYGFALKMPAADTMYFDENGKVCETNDLFEIPFFRKLFYHKWLKLQPDIDKAFF